MPGELTDPRWFRTVLGQYPTGVSVITTTEADGTRAGFVVGTFSSISLNPPLVGFMPDKGSSSWPRIRAAGKFCVNILSADQEHLCRQFASKNGDRFAGVATRESGLGNPILEDAVAWIDCTLDNVVEAGDHYIVMGAVNELDIESGSLPLLFFQGGYGRFAPHSMVAAYTPAEITSEQLRSVDLIRPIMERLADDLSSRCIATAAFGEDLVVLAGAGSPDAQDRATLVGARLPFTPPNGSAIGAWNDGARLQEWLSTGPDGEAREENERRLARVRERGYSVGLLNDAQRQFAAALNRLAEDPQALPPEDLRALMADLLYDPEELTEEHAQAVRVIAVPIFDAEGKAAFAFTLYGFAKPEGEAGIRAYIDRVVQAGREATAALGGRVPAPAAA
ncbi:MAG: flavin reductase [Leucobacter sp.]